MTSFSICQTTYNVFIPSFLCANAIGHAFLISSLGTREELFRLGLAPIPIGCFFHLLSDENTGRNA